MLKSEIHRLISHKNTYSISQDKGSQKAIGLEKTTENTIRELQNGIFELESRYEEMEVSLVILSESRKSFLKGEKMQHVKTFNYPGSTVLKIEKGGEKCQ